ncbi:MAG: helix-turn-helix domain-containing protein [Desulfobaccales bacterium]
MSRKMLFSHETFPGLADRIREVRGKLTQEKFGELLGISKAQVSKYESQKAFPSSETIDRIVSLGSKTREWLLWGAMQGELREGSENFKKPGPGAQEINDPYLFAAVDTSVLAQIIAGVESALLQKHKTLNSVRKAHLISLLYDRFQETGKPVDRQTIEEFFRLVS